MRDDQRSSQYKTAFYMALVGSVVATFFVVYMLITKGLPETSEAKAAYAKFLILLAFLYLGCFIMRYRYKKMK